ncbi:carbohydrate ABC transporter permease [Arthrobacter sp. APC 3897]|uniref:carbohydrate ABC transporter permease n=1 Tax=Arthrobacter sp. APC 3897 TaxID=3035204 RepID=UPI0025B4CD26|nr:carbohydrate ABC transporter permease [Arthrobacter sp. APC 3897]MDN3483194.1 carbohydrate ABC transporter permease [Arthrobacter sp. APC 3897]
MTRTAVSSAAGAAARRGARNPTRPATAGTPRRGRRPLTPGRVLTYLALTAGAVVVLFPVYFGFVGSFMGPGDINSYPASLWPLDGFRAENFTGALSSIPLGRQYVNSVVMAGLITLGQLVTSLLAAYALVFLKVRWRSFWFALFLCSMMVPSEAIIIPNYLTMSSLGLINTTPALVLPFLAHGFGIFLLRQAFLSFPVELWEASRIDGAGHFRFLISVLVPLSKPTLAALGIWSFLSAWNMYFWPLLVTQTPEMQTIQIGITQLRSADNFNAGLVLAGTVLAIIPTLLLVIFGQRFIVRGLTAGSLK